MAHNFKTTVKVCPKMLLQICAPWSCLGQRWGVFQGPGYHFVVSGVFRFVSGLDPTDVVNLAACKP